MPNVDILNSNKQITCPEGANLLEVLRQNDIWLDSPCGGNGTCGKCKVRILSVDKLRENAFDKTFDSDELQATSQSEIRLACQTTVCGDMAIELLADEDFTSVQNNTVVHAESTESVRIHYKVDADFSSDAYGVAIDIGTTTVVCQLIHLQTGELYGTVSGLNPQTIFGLDVISRISYEQTHPESGIQELQQCIVQSLNALICKLCNEKKLSVNDIQRIAVGANCTMIHMLLGVDATSIGKAPFRPAFTEAQTLWAKEIGIVTENAMLYCLPSVSAYIGGDVVAGAYICNLRERTGNVLLIDIGTNGELVLSRDGEMVSCSCAAGPALEGMNIRSGMRAETGAIQRVQILPTGIELNVIGAAKPRGLCGSGILSVIKEFLRTGILRKSGKIVSPGRISEGDYRKKLLYQESDDTLSVILDVENPELRVTQKDIRQVQLAKGALRSGFEALLQYAGIDASDLDCVFVAGQFGFYLTESELIGTGILPPEVHDRIEYVGNTSLAGAKAALCSQSVREVLENQASNTAYLELAELPNYQELLAECLEFPSEKTLATYDWLE